MRIIEVYDDELQAKAIEVFNNAFEENDVLKNAHITTEYVQRKTTPVNDDRAIKFLRNIFRENHFLVGDSFTRYNIGNNRVFPVYTYTGEEKRTCCYLNYTIGVYSISYAFLTDYHDNRITTVIEIDRA